MLFQNDIFDPFTIIFFVFIFTSCLCGPIARALQERRMRQRTLNLHQARAVEQAREGGHFGPSPEIMPSKEDKELQFWEETLLTTKDHARKLEAIAKLGILGIKETGDLLSEYAEHDRNPEILSAIEAALEQIEQRQINRRVPVGSEIEDD